MLLNAKASRARVLVALPPKTFFGGNDRHNAEELLRSLRQIFPNVFVFDIGTYVGPDHDAIDSLIAEARAFKADVAISLPNGGYAMMLDEKLRRWRYRPEPTRFQEALRRLRGTTPANVLADVLRLPTVLLWDHIITQPSYLVLGDLPRSSADGAPGALRRLRRALSNPRFHHVVPDSGHIKVLEELGILPRHVRRYVVPAHAEFLSSGPVPDGHRTDALLFAGNLNPDGRGRFEGFDRAMVDEMNDEMVAAKRANWGASSWQLLRDAAAARIGRLPAASPDNTFFWSLANVLLGNLTTAHRREVLSQAPLPVDYHGGFADPEHARSYASSGRIVHRGSVPFDDLPKLYSSYRLSVDVTNCPFINGSNAKVLDCFAAGGFMLVDWRQDLAQELGDVARTFMYRDRGELMALGERILGDTKLRAEVIATMREKIGRSLTFSHLLRDSIEQVL